MDLEKFKEEFQNKPLGELYTKRDYYEHAIFVKNNPDKYSETAVGRNEEYCQEKLKVLEEIILKKEYYRNNEVKGVEEQLESLFCERVSSDFKSEEEKESEYLLLVWCEHFLTTEIEPLKFMSLVCKLASSVQYINSMTLENIHELLIYAYSFHRECCLKVAYRIIEVIKAEGTSVKEYKVYDDK